MAPPTAPGGFKRELDGPLARSLMKSSEIEPVEIFRYRVQLNIDSESGMVVAEVRSKETGDLVRTVPSETVLRHAAMLKDSLGTLLDIPS